jgi:uncharacterized BrkB/YihY/UPF0761 family membrane protein
MERRKLKSAALVLTLLGALLFMPPIATVFQIHRLVLGVPAEVIYLFFVWVLLVIGAWWLSRRLPREGEDEG